MPFATRVKASINRFSLILLLVFSLCAISGLEAQDTSVLTKIEKAALRKIATEWVKLGSWCVSRELGEQARLCVEKAEKADKEAFGVETLKDKADKCANAPEESDNEKLLGSWDKKFVSVKRKLAGYYDKLFAAGLKLSDSDTRKRFEEYLWAALELCPNEKRWKTILSLIDASLKAGETETAARLAGNALALKPPEKYAGKFKYALDAAAIDKVVLKSALSHSIKYYFSLPKNYKRKKDRKWPILVCVDGAGSGFKGMANGYLNSRGNFPFIIVSPCTFANTNKIEDGMLEKYRKLYSDDVISKGKAGRLDWDEEGILAIIKELQEEYDAESRIYITGFSGGGKATYMMVFKHPDLLNGAAPACGNFSSRSYSRLKNSFSDEARNFPVHMITGEKDPHREFTFGDKNIPGIEPQTDLAERLLKELKYPNYKRTMVPGMGHSAAQKHVIDTFKPYWEDKKKRGDKLD